MVVVNMEGICNVVARMSMWRAQSRIAGGEVLWCMHNTCTSQLSIRGLIRSSGGIVGSSYVMVSALKWVMTCESKKGPSWG